MLAWRPAGDGGHDLARRGTVELWGMASGLAAAKRGMRDARRLSMTGGWRPSDLEEYTHLLPKRRLAELNGDEKKVDALLATLHEAARFKRRAIRLLLELELTFVEWRVLRATQRAVLELDDAVSQQEVARYAVMDEGSVCVAMRRLYQRGLVDIGFDAWGWSERILLMQRGREKLEQAEPRIASLPMSCSIRWPSSA